MNPLNKEEVKAKIVAELEIAHLPQEEQEAIIATLAEALLERATVIMMAKIPESEMERIDQLAESGNQEELKANILQFVPDAPQIIDSVIADGVAEYKQLVEQEKQAEEAVSEPTSATAPTPTPQAPTEENFVVDDSGEAQPSTSLADSVTPSQPAY